MNWENSNWKHLKNRSIMSSSAAFELAIKGDVKNNLLFLFVSIAPDLSFANRGFVHVSKCSFEV
jgi:hypothetical protein